jgi:hypothetical protein
MEPTYSCHSSGTYNFELVPRFLENSCTHDLQCPLFLTDIEINCNGLINFMLTPV